MDGNKAELYKKSYNEEIFDNFEEELCILYTFSLCPSSSLQNCWDVANYSRR